MVAYVHTDRRRDTNGTGKKRKHDPCKMCRKKFTKTDHKVRFELQPSSALNSLDLYHPYYFPGLHRILKITMKITAQKMFLKEHYPSYPNSNMDSQLTWSRKPEVVLHETRIMLVSVFQDIPFKINNRMVLNFCKVEIA